MSIIRNPTFRLTTFRNEMFDLEPTLPFLRSQPDLAVWQQRQSTPCEFSDDLLTHLTDAAVDSRILQQLTLRLLTRIATKIERRDAVGERQFGDMLGAFGQSLLELELERDVGGESLLMAEFIAILAANLPLLNHLTLQNQGEMSTESTSQKIAVSLSAFHQLSTVFLAPSRSTNRNSFCMDIISLDGGTQAVSTFFRFSNSLKRVALPTSDGSSVWYAKSPNDSLVGDKVVRWNTVGVWSMIRGALGFDGVADNISNLE